MRILTWNINSVRLRIDHVRRLAERSDADIICLQETKVVDELFPHEAIHEMGYVPRAVRGMKSYNGGNEGLVPAQRLPPHLCDLGGRYRGAQFLYPRRRR